MTPAQPPLLQVRNLQMAFPLAGRHWFSAKRTLRAVDGISFHLQAGEVLGVVGESGCGKSTLARAILRLIDPTAGSVHFSGTDLGQLKPPALRELRPRMQMIFQDPHASLNPRLSIGESIAEPLQITEPKFSRATLYQRVLSLLDQVGLSVRQLNRYPHELSGGQCQRVGIARALITNPRLLICDEPVSALDVSVQAQIINLLKDLQHERQLALLFIAHDLSVVKHISDRVMVLYLGKIVEIGSTAAIFHKPQHPYTQALMQAVPVPDPVLQRTRRAVLLKGEAHSPTQAPTGCAFANRCLKVTAQCQQAIPELKASSHTEVQAACFLTG